MRRDHSRWTTRGVALVAAILAALVGLPAQPALAVCGDGVVNVDAGEDCDDGGLCTGGDHAGEKCPAAVSGGVDCGEGVACKTFGGDGCSATCLNESRRAFNFDPTKSQAATQAALFALTFPISGGQVLTTSSHHDANGNYSIVIKAADVHIEPIQVPPPGGLCACVRGVAVKTCGGGPTGRICTDDPSVCPAEEGQCVFVHGPGNSASGTLACGAGGLSPVDSEITRNHNTHLENPDPDPECTAAGAALDTNKQHQGPPPACNGPTSAILTGDGPRGSALVLNSLSISTIPDGGMCDTETTTRTKICLGGTSQGTNCSRDDTLCTGGGTCVAAKGPDGIPCTDDDPNQAAPATIPLTTSDASAMITNANNSKGKVLGPNVNCGALKCIALLTGAPFDCDALAADPAGGTDSISLVSAFPALDNTTLGDLLVTTKLASLPPPAACVGDCDLGGTVGVDELVKGVNIALGTATPDTCTAFDTDKNGRVTVEELVQGVNNALNGCSAS